MTVLGDDPIMMLSAPIPATKLALKRCGMSMRDIDLVTAAGMREFQRLLPSASQKLSGDTLRT